MPFRTSFPLPLSKSISVSIMDNISIEQTNKVRRTLGLKPLPVPGEASSAADRSNHEDVGSTLESRQALAEDNWQQKQKEAAAEAKRKAKNRAIQRARELAQRHSVIEGKGLGDADDREGDLNTKAWLAGSKKRRKKLEKERAARLARELEERDNLAEYTAEDLEGLKVAHELDEVAGDSEQVLVLKDATIDEYEEEGDELENIDLKESERLAEQLELKKKKAVYNPMDDAFDGDSNLLKQYDETISGKKRKYFTLDGQGRQAEAEDSLESSSRGEVHGQSISLDFVKDEAPISDYQTALEPKFKKPKKIAKTRRKPIDEDDIFPVAQHTEANGDAMQIDNRAGAPSVPGVSKSRSDQTSFIDDDDLQASLALQRQLALKKRKRQRPEDIVRQMREEEAAKAQNPDLDEEEPGLVIDDTTQFLAHLDTIELSRKAEQEARDRAEAARALEQAQVDQPASPMAKDSPDGVASPKERELALKREDSDVDMDRRSATPAETGVAPAEELTQTGIEQEEHVSSGLGATVRLLTARGLLKPREGEAEDTAALQRERQRFLAAKLASEKAAEARAHAQRAMDRESGRLDRMSAKEREEHARWENKQRESIEARRNFELYNKEYKPDVRLRYADDLGRGLGPKEAFKHMSHQFHGKGSGKLKTEKRLKRVEKERKAESESILDGGGKTGGLEGGRSEMGRRKGEAGIRLA